MKNLFFIESGMGIDVHGQDVNVAAKRAVTNAIHYNSMPGIRSISPDGNIEKMKVNIKLAMPKDLEKLDENMIKEMIPYGIVSVEVMFEEMASTSGVFL